jgi:hypothetical protein
MVPGTYSGRANVAEFDAERDKVRDYPKTFAGCLIYEVFYHSIMGGGDYVWSAPPVGSLASFGATPAADTLPSVLPGDITTIRRALGLP